MASESHSPEESDRSAALPPNVKAAGWVSFFTDLGSELIYPLLPAFITGDLGASKTMLGLIEGLSEATPSVFKLLAGAWADRVKNRKWLIFFGYLISSCIKPLIGLSTTAWQVLGLRFSDRIGKGIRTAPRDALIADSTPEPIRGKAFGFHRAMDHLGALGGGMVAWLLMRQLGMTIKDVIIFSVIPGVLCLVTILLMIHEVPDRKLEEKPSISSGLSGLPSSFWKLLLGVGGFSIANSSDAFLLLRSAEMGIDLVTIPLVWSFLHVVKAVTCYYGGKLSDQIGHRPVMAGGWLLYSGVYIGFALASGPTAVWVLFGIYGFFFGATEGVAKAWVAKLIPPEKRGTAFGLMGLLEGLLLLPSSLLTGYLWDQSGSFLPLALASAFSLLAAIWIMFALPEKE